MRDHTYHDGSVRSSGVPCCVLWRVWPCVPVCICACINVGCGCGCQDVHEGEYVCVCVCVCWLPSQVKDGLGSV